MLFRSGAEFGATTGRRRRCGWLDLVILRDSVRLNGLSSLSVTKLDVLTGLETLKICVGYEIQGKRFDSRPSSLKRLARCTPIYEEMPGWQEDISHARKLDQLPDRAKAYLKRIEELTEVPFSIISIGPAREQTIILQDLF